MQLERTPYDGRLAVVPVGGDGLGQRGDAQFRGGIVGLAKVTDQTGGADSMNVGTTVLLAENFGGGTAYIESAVEVNVHHQLPLFQ